jgi:hypothetical protein
MTREGARKVTQAAKRALLWLAERCADLADWFGRRFRP